MIEGIEHIGIAVKDVENTLKLYASIFGLKPEEITILEDYGLKVGSIQIGDTKLEFLESIRKDTPIAKFIEKRGQGIHHVCFQVDDIEKTLKRLAQDGIELVDKKPKPGARGDKIAFIHPRSTSGILIELCEV
jgi:methylmalonyl-CoA/ethylmalonyl-CoA epimerase